MASFPIGEKSYHGGFFSYPTTVDVSRRCPLADSAARRRDHSHSLDQEHEHHALPVPSARTSTFVR